MLLALALTVPGLRAWGEVPLAQKIAQMEGDDSYDPFTDYSEFEDAAEEEADINFFRNGRFFTLGFTGGARAFTSVYGEVFDPGALFGLSITYFFDLRFALQFSYTSSDHTMYIPTPTDPATGNVSLTGFSFDLKYFMNTQNVTRGLASLNPYLVLGFTSFNRTVSFSSEPDPIQDGNMGFDMGIGIEIPMLRNKMFFGAQFCYHYANFVDENQQAQIRNQLLNIFYQGDVVSTNMILGINF
jgi:lipid-A-disaccharide synthase-like uncharacterized protein